MKINLKDLILTKMGTEGMSPEDAAKDTKSEMKNLVSSEKELKSVFLEIDSIVAEILEDA